MAEIRRYLKLLESENYQDRELAEEKLTEGTIGSRFMPLIRAESEHPQLEIRHRIKRILLKLADAELETISEFDVLTLDDGTKLEGDAGSFQLECLFRDQALILSREDVALITRAAETPAPVADETTPVRVELFQQYIGQFYQPANPDRL